MAKYLSKTITEENGNQSTAFIAVELVANLLTGKAHIKEGGWKTGQKIADGLPQSRSQPILWVEPDINALLCASNDYTTDTPIVDVIFDAIATRMATLDDVPDGSKPNPFKGCTFVDIPAPTA